MDLSLYEWSLSIERYNVTVEQRKFDYERSWEQTRRIWVILANVYRDTKLQPKPFTVQDLIKLSYDTVDDTLPKRMTPKEMKQLFGSKFKKDGSK